MLKVKLVSATIALALPTSLLAETEFFGRLSASYAYGKEDGQYSQQMSSNGSRLGVRGFNDLKLPDTDVIYMIEGNFDLSDGDVFTDMRQAWVGLRGGFGEVRAGRQLGSTQVSSQWARLFQDQYGDYDRILKTEVSHKQSLAYVAKSGSLGFAATISADDNMSSSTNNITATDVMVNYYENGIYGALGHVRAPDNFYSTRVTGGYQFPEGHKLGLVLEQTRHDDGRGHNALLFGGGYKSGDLTFKGQYGFNDPRQEGATEALMAFGVDYAIGQRTSITFEHVVNRHRDHVQGDKSNTTALGIVHRF